MTDAPALRMLVVTDDARFLTELAATDEAVVLIHTRRPAETIRRFESEPPDVVVIELSARPDQDALLIDAICERPLGTLVPIFVVDRRGEASHHPLTTPEGAREAGAERFFPVGSPSSAIVAAAAQAMGVALAHDVAPRPPAPPPVWSSSRLPAVPARPAARSEGLAAPDEPWPAESGGVSAESIRRKVRQARHEDYFALLEIRKSADPSQIEEAYRQMRIRFDPNRLPRSIADRHFAELSELIDAIDDAYGVLGDEPLRKAYLAAVLRAGG